MDSSMASGEKVYPGKMLTNTLAGIKAGEGTYVYLGKVYAQIQGTVKVLKS